MKPKSFLLSLSVLTLLVFAAASGRSQTVITFDDMSSSIITNGAPFYYTVVTNGYQGFNWENFYTLNGPVEAKMFGTNGGYYGMVSASNVAFNLSGNPAAVDASGSNFSFLSAYLSGAWNSNLNIEIDALNGSTLLYSTTVVVSATSPTLFTFNYLNINRLTFFSFGGQSAGFPNGGGEEFVMDNLTFEIVPEPSTLLLASLGSVMLWPILKRKRG